MPFNDISHDLSVSRQREADNYLQHQLGGITNEVIEYLLDKQRLTTGSILVEREHVRQWAARYWGAIRRAAVIYAEGLARDIGLRKGLGPADLKWIRREIGAFFRRHIFGGEPATFLTRSSAGVAEMQAPMDIDSYFQFTLERYAKAPLLMKPVMDKLVYVQQLYARTKKRKFDSDASHPTAAQKLANPEAHPYMDAKEIAGYCQVSRSTVARWVDEGKIKRAGMGKKAGKRTRLLVLTQSLKRYLQESSE